MRSTENVGILEVNNSLRASEKGKFKHAGIFYPAYKLGACWRNAL